MAAVAALPEDLQLRVRAMVSGQPDPAARGRGATGREGGRRAEGEKEAKSEHADWITYSDEHLRGAGFLGWTPFEHPQLGAVEIGGLVPGIKHEPPESEWDRIADEQTDFVVALLGILPRLEASVVETERIGAGVWRVRVRATNSGELPTRSAIGVKARRMAPIVATIGVEVADVVSGQPVQRWDVIPAHGSYADAEWIIRAPDGATIPVAIRSNVFGDRTLDVVLEETE
jgi:hypothetical protein